MAVSSEPIALSAFMGKDSPSRADLSRCVHCGLCLMNCPTFVATGLETESPRGRLHLIRAADEGRIEINASFISHMELCLQCRNCEAVCPSGVPFGRIMEATRSQILTQRKGRPSTRILRTAITRTLFPHKRLIGAAAAAMRLYQHAGPRRLLHRSGVIKLLPRPLRELEALMPDLSVRPFNPHHQEYAPFGPRRHRVAMLTGCVMPHMYAATENATLQVLRRNGCEVVIPAAQQCCGALLVHGGDREAARDLARRNIDAFLPAGVEAIIVNAAGCGSTMKEYGELLAGDPLYAEPAKHFDALVKDISEYLVFIHFDRAGLGSIEATVAYQDSCHLAHAQRITDAPREVIRAIPGVRFVELASDRCCGSAGIYNITQREMSMEVLNTKMTEVEEVMPDILVTANPGCMLQLATGVRRSGLNARVEHVVDLLEAAYRAGDAASPQRRTAK
jgi:glycolate oxidase iron-sulfur subunit